MAQEHDTPSTTEKGKGKANLAKPKDGQKHTQDRRNSKDGKRLADGAKDDEENEEDMSEEDQNLKTELEMLVTRLKEQDVSLYIPALESIKDFIKTSTSSMTAVPKPLKFLRPHYEDLCSAYESWPAGEEKHAFADVLSVLGMTQGDDDRLDTLKFRLAAPSQDLGSWGHEYVRHLALEIGQDFQRRLGEETDVEELIALTRNLVPYFLTHNAEADAVDIMSEMEMIQEIPQYLDENTYARVCLYMVSMVNLLTYPDDQQFLQTAHDVYKQYKKLPQAMVLAIRLNDIDLIQKDFDSTEDVSLKRQMALLVARQQIWLPADDVEDQQLAECMSNEKLPDHFKSLGKELNILEPRLPEDIYKSHLESTRTAGLTNVDSARHNLASAFVNAFTNAGFGQDKLLLNVSDGDRTSWIFKTKDDGQFSTAASLGMLLRWDIENGLEQVDKYTYSEDTQVKAGALLATGMLNSAVRMDTEPALALLATEENLNAKEKQIRLASIMGLGLACAGTKKEELLELLLPIVEDSALEMQLSAIAALSLGLVFVGSSDDRVSQAIITTLLDPERQTQLKDKWTRFMSLGLALLFFGREEEVEVILETLKVIDHSMAKPAGVLAEVCAYAGTGTVLKLQELLHLCNDHYEGNSEEKKEDELIQTYAVLGLALIAMGEDVGQEMVLRQFGHLMHYGEANIRKAVPLAMGLISPSNPQMKVYDTLSRYSHDNDNDVAVNAIFAMGLLGAGTNNARLAQLLRQLASYYHRDQNSLFMVRIAQGLVHMGKGTLSINPFHTDRQILSRVAAAGLLTVLVAMIDAKQFILAEHHYLLYFLVTAMHPRFLVTLDEDLKPLQVNVRVGQAVDVVGQAGRPKTITGWQTQSTPVLLGYGERAELEDEEYISLASNLEGLVILKKNPAWEEG